MENKYKNGKIYKIVSPSNPELVYYGSTTQRLCSRMAVHKCLMTTSSKQLIELGDAEIILVENYPCNNKKELLKKEGEYILNNECINTKIAGRTTKEYQQTNEAWKEYHRQYQKEWQKQYRLRKKNNN